MSSFFDVQTFLGPASIDVGAALDVVECGQDEVILRDRCFLPELLGGGL